MNVETVPVNIHECLYVSQSVIQIIPDSLAKDIVNHEDRGHEACEHGRSPIFALTCAGHQRIGNVSVDIGGQRLSLDVPGNRGAHGTAILGLGQLAAVAANLSRVVNALDSYWRGRYMVALAEEQARIADMPAYAEHWENAVDNMSPDDLTGPAAPAPEKTAD